MMLVYNGHRIFFFFANPLLFFCTTCAENDIALDLVLTFLLIPKLCKIKMVYFKLELS